MIWTIDRMTALLAHHDLTPAVAVHGGSEFHMLLNELDKKIGVDTRGGVRHNTFLTGVATPRNQVGTRIRLHEAYTRMNAFDNEGYVSCSHWGLFKGEGR